MTMATRFAIELTENIPIPDVLIRSGIRRLIRKRIKSLHMDDCEQRNEIITGFVRNMQSASVAPLPDKANEQHYEVSAAFFTECLGKYRKYSCCYWPEGITNLDEAEAAGLHETCMHAGIEDGHRVLELGCGWGSLTLWVAEHYPNTHITAVSNSYSQKRFIEAEARRRDLPNVNIITADMNNFDTGDVFDRVVSVEMFEHMRNYSELMQRIYRWLKPGGRFLMHIFCHRDIPYEFISDDDSDWMSRHFFTGGIMPCDELPIFFQDDLKLLSRWRWDGTHYAKTSEAWLRNMSSRKEKIMPLLEQTYGIDVAAIWFQRWRIFFMACAELFGFENGQQWWVSHYLFERPR